MISDDACSVPPETPVALLPLRGMADVAAPVVQELINAPAKEIVLFDVDGFVIARKMFAVKTPGKFPTLKRYTPVGAGAARILIVPVMIGTPVSEMT